MSIAPNTPGWTHFTVPSWVLSGASTLFVITNGIKSAGVPVNVDRNGCAFQSSATDGLAPLAVTFKFMVKQGDDVANTIDFGDGTGTSPLTAYPTGVACAVNTLCYTGAASISHTYTSAGIYTATVRNSAQAVVATIATAVTAPGSVSTRQVDQSSRSGR
jgi:PKD repeat protein